MEVDSLGLTERERLEKQVDLADSFQALRRQGYVSIPGMLDSVAISRLKEGVAELEGLPVVDDVQWRHYRNNTTYRPVRIAKLGCTVTADTLGVSPVFDHAIEEILLSPLVRAVLESVLGPGYKLWQIGVRISREGDPGLPFHQDNRGEFGMLMLLDDVKEAGGSTVFIPGTHLWPLTIREAVVYPLLPLWLARLFKSVPATGHAGDVYFFFNRVWHGRTANAGPMRNQGVFISFFPVGADYEVHFADDSTLARLAPETRQRVDSSRLVDVGNKRFRVLPEPGNPDVVPATFRDILTATIPSSPALRLWQAVVGGISRKAIVLSRWLREH